MVTNAKTLFDVSIQRAGYFLETHEDACDKPGRPVRRLDELPRAAVVFAIGSLDAYLCEVTAEALLTQLQAAPATAKQRDVLKKVTTAVPGLPLEVAILDKQDERLGRIHEAIVEYFVNQTSMFGTTGVANAVSRLGGDARDVWSKLPTEDKKPQTELTEWTDMRHEIVHQGKSPRLIREEGWRCVRFVKALVEAIDHVVAKLLEAPPE